MNIEEEFSRHQARFAAKHLDARFTAGDRPDARPVAYLFQPDQTAETGILPPLFQYLVDPVIDILADTDYQKDAKAVYTLASEAIRDGANYLEVRKIIEEQLGGIDAVLFSHILLKLDNFI